MYVDVHAHLDFKEFDGDRDKVIKKCQDMGVKVIVNNGVDVNTNRKVLEISKKFSIIRPSFGFYPVHVAELGIKEVKKEIEWIKKNKPIAIGEVGLDYKVGDDNPNGDLHKEVQIEAFRLFIQLSKELKIPIIVHSRKAEEDVLDILEEENATKVVLHCFMGKKKYIERATKSGFSFSIPVSAVKLEQLQWLVKHVPLPQLLTETDSPYQSPVIGERNDPSNIPKTIDKIALIKGITSEECMKIIWMNYQKMFV